MNALRDAIAEQRRTTAGRTCAVTPEQARRLGAFCISLSAAPNGANSEAIADGLAAAAAIAGQSDFSPEQATSWSAQVSAMPAVKGRKLTLTAPEGDALELFFDANDTFYIGNLATGALAERRVLAFTIVTGPAGARITHVDGSAKNHPAAQPAFGDPFGAVAAMAGAAAAVLIHTRREPAAPAPAKPSEAESLPVRFCEQCGQPRKAGARFCGHCGTAFPETSPTQEASKVSTLPICNVCGAERAPQWKFCKRCGAKFLQAT
jgi:ribosomal protein L40E